MSLDLNNFGFNPSSGGGGISPSGIQYVNSQPLILKGSYATGDSYYFYSLGNYDRTPPAYPEAFAQINYLAEQSDVRAVPASGTSLSDSISPTILKSNNAFGNKLRFTDSLGNPSDAVVGSNIWAHVDWRSHSFSGAISGYVIDHLTGWGYNVNYMIDGTFFNMNTSTSDGQNWSDWMNFIAGLGTFLGLDGWIPLDLNDQFAYCQAIGDTTLWSSNFLTYEATESGSTRGTVITGETNTPTGFLPFFDTGSAIVVQGLGSAGSSSFAFRIANCFIKRKHY